MRIGYLDSKIFLEGIDITNYVTKYQMYFGKGGSPMVQLGLSVKGQTNKLLPGTILQIFTNDPGDALDRTNWYLFFEGALVAKNFLQSDSSIEVSLRFSATSKILDDTKYTRGGNDPGNANELDAYIGNVLLVNVGTKNTTAPNKLPAADGNIALDYNVATDIFKTPGIFSAGILAAEAWKVWRQAGKGYADFMVAFIDGMGINNPYFKIITESMRFQYQILVYANEQLYDTFITIGAFDDMNKDMSNAAILQTYRSLLNQFLSFDMCTYLEFGIPTLIGNTPKQGVIIPSLDFTVPPVFNVIYPDEFENYNLSVEYSNEPTRAKLNSPPASFLSGIFDGISQNVIPTFLSPSDQLELDPIADTKDGKNISYYLKFTEEEKYRGVNAVEVNANGFEYGWTKMGTPMTDSIATIYDPANSADIIKDISGFLPKYQAYMRWLSDYNYYKTRLAARGFGTITTGYYNPNWLIGFPGIIDTLEYGPIMVNFDSVTITGDASGTCTSTLSVSSPRFTRDQDRNEVVKMDLPSPDWYDPIFRKDNIGKQFYQQFAKNKQPASIIDATGTHVSLTKVTTTQGSSTAPVTVAGEKKSVEATRLSPIKAKNDFESSIENAAIAIHNNYLDGHGISMFNRKRNFIDSESYFKNLNVLTENGFPSTRITQYRTIKDIDALKIATEAAKEKKLQDFTYLRCPYVKERAQAVLSWLGKNDKLIDYDKKLKFEDPTSGQMFAMTKAGSYTPVVRKNGKYVPMKSSQYHEKVGAPIDIGNIDLKKVPEDIPSIRPCPDKHVSSPFGWRMISLDGGPKKPEDHDGVDLAGSSEIIAPADGIVTFVGWDRGYGNTVKILHHKDDFICETLYGHMKSPSILKVGDIVSRGVTVIGYTGRTGTSTGVHLHYRIHKGDGTRLDPWDYFPHLTSDSPTLSQDKQDAIRSGRG